MTTQNDTSRPNIILITVDCWRGDHVGFAPSARAQTPNIDELAKESLCFTQAQTCGGWTKIAMTALFSSTYSSQYDFARGKITNERPLLAEELQKVGYETAGFTTNLVCGSPQGFDRGFDNFEDLRPVIKTSITDRILAIRGMKRMSRYRWFRRMMAMIGLQFKPLYPTVDADGLVTHALDWLDQPREKPYFLWLHFMDLHWPYSSASRPKDFAEQDEMWIDRIIWRKVRDSRGRFNPGDARIERWQDLYREETEAFDNSLSTLFSSLRKRTDWDNTHVMMTGDHGEEFFEHGTWAHSWNQLYSEGINVPFIWRLAKGIKSRIINEPVSHIDISPTILDIANAEPPAAMCGKSLYSLLGEQKEDTRPVLSEMHGHAKSIKYRLAIIHDGHKYIYDGDRDRCHLYNLSNDPGEQVDLYNKQDDLCRQFDRMRLAHVTKGVLNILKSGLPVIGEDILYDLDADPIVIERLKALGYLD